MGRRHLSNRSQFFRIDQDQSQSHVADGRSNIHMGRAVPPQNGSFSQHMENIPTSGLNHTLQNNLRNRLFEPSSTNFRLERPQVHAPVSGPSHDIIPHFSARESFQRFPESNAVHAYSGHYNRHIMHDESGLHQTLGNRRGPFKRKSPSAAVSFERGSTSRSHGAGSSSGSFGLQPEKPISDYGSYSSASICLAPFRSGSLSIGGEDYPRNVRSRSRLDLGPNPRRNHLLSHSSNSYYPTSQLRDHPQPLEVRSSNVVSTAYEQNHIGVPHARRRFQSSANNSLSYEMNRSYIGGVTADVGGYCPESILRRNPVSAPQYLHGLNAQASRVDHNDYSLRAVPLHRTYSTSLLGQEATSLQNGHQFLSETHPSRYARTFSAGGWHNNRPEERSMVAFERFQSLSNMVDAHNRMGSQALMMLDCGHSYDSTYFFDEYRNMRLDIDNMGYEELLALGERIGNVNTGLTDDVIWQCLSLHPSSEKNQEESSCAICLEEYKNMENVGMLKNCGHDYHTDCIRKWLSMKNACPICKAPALADSSKE